jgi:WD40 repeat protein
VEQENRVRVWDAASGQELRTFKLHQAGDNRIVVFSPDGTRLAATGSLWDVATGKQLFEGSTWAVAFSPDGTRLAWAERGNDHTVRIWDAANGQELRTLKTAALSPAWRSARMGGGWP